MRIRLVLFAFSLFLCLPVNAQYTVGQTVYLNYCGSWREAKVIKWNQTQVQLQVRNALTGQWDHDGDQWTGPEYVTTVRPANFDPYAYGNELGALKKTPIIPQTSAQAPTQQLPLQQRPIQVGNHPAPTTGSVMSEGEVLGFLSANLGPTPFSMPWDTRTQVFDQLANMVKSRGVNFRYQSMGPFYDQIAKYGAPTEVTAALRENFGTPVKADWYMGAWHMDQHGAPTTYIKDARLMEKQYFGKSGTLKINRDGSYFWNAAGGPIQGTWRKSTQADFKGISKGGEGVVLTRAKTGTDWLVYEDDKSPGESIIVSEVGFPDHLEVGGRIN